MANIYFTKRYPGFFKELELNNNTAWFNENRKRYESDVKKPFEDFISDLIAAIKKQEPSVDMTAKEAIFRINKDIRFSKDKLPYKTSMSAAITRQGRNPDCPGIYIEISGSKIFIIMGLYAIEKDNLFKLRTALFNSYPVVNKLVSSKSFVEKFGKVQGEKNKILSSPFKDFVGGIPLLANKQFYYMASLPFPLLTSEKLYPVIMSYYKAGKPVNDFLHQAIGS